MCQCKNRGLPIFERFDTTPIQYSDSIVIPNLELSIQNVDSNGWVTDGEIKFRLDVDLTYGRVVWKVIDPSTGETVYSSKTASWGLRARLKNTYYFSVPAKDNYTVKFDLYKRNWYTGGAKYYKTLTYTIKASEVASPYLAIDIPEEKVIIPYPPAGMSGAAPPLTLKNGMVVYSAEVESCRYKSTMPMKWTSTEYRIIKCCMPEAGKVPVYIDAYKYVLYPLDKKLSLIHKRLSFSDGAEWKDVYVIDSNVNFLVPLENVRYMSSAIVKYVHNVTAVKPSYTVRFTPASDTIPLMQNVLPAKVDLRYTGPSVVENVNGEYGYGIYPYCPAFTIRIDGVKYITPSECTGDGYGHIKVLISPPAENKPGASGAKKYTVELLGADGGVFAKKSATVSVTRGYGFVEGSKFTMEFDVTTSHRITSAYLESSSGGRIQGTIVDPYSKVAFIMTGKVVDSDYKLTVCNEAEACDTVDVTVKGSPKADISVTAVCVGGEVLQPGELTVRITDPANGATISPGSYRIKAEAYVGGGIGSVTRVDFYADLLSSSGPTNICHGTAYTPESGNTYGYTCSLTQEGKYKITVYARDSFGNTKSDRIYVTVSSSGSGGGGSGGGSGGGGSGGGGDGGATVYVHIRSPSDGDIFTTTGDSYTLTINAYAYGTYDIAKVEFYDNGVLIGTDTTAGLDHIYSLTADFGVGQHTIKAVAYDVSKEHPITGWDQITITVEKIVTTTTTTTTTTTVTTTGTPPPRVRIDLYVVSTNGLDYFAGEYSIGVGGDGKVYTFGYYNPSLGEGTLFADPRYDANVESVYYLQSSKPKAGYYEFYPSDFYGGTTKITDSPWCSKSYNKQPGGSYVVSCS